MTVRFQMCIMVSEGLVVGECNDEGRANNWAEKGLTVQ